MKTDENKVKAIAKRGRRLKARQDSYDQMPPNKLKNGHLYHRPGSNKK